MNERRVGLLLAACGLAASPGFAGPPPLVTVFTEDFEGFTLFPNIEEGVVTGNPQEVEEAFYGDGNDSIPFDGAWSANGWEQTFNLNGVGTAEWEGWSVANKEFWFNADFQGRENFTRASGQVAVADCDEWDDYDPSGLDPETVGPYNTTLDTPSFSVDGTDAGSIVVAFDSSWRPECDTSCQEGRVYVQYDGGAWEEVLHFHSDSNDPDFKPDATDERVELEIDNPTATSMRLRFEMTEAGNDWWWAIDNIVVAGTGGDPVLPPEPFDLFVDQFHDNLQPMVSWTTSINATEYDVVFSDADGVAHQVTTTNLMYTPPAGALEAGIYDVSVVARNSIGTEENSATIGLDNPCPADLNGDTVLDIFDVLDYLAAFDGGC